MRGISLQRDERTTILIPADELDDAQRAVWARQAAGVIADAHDLAESERDALVRTIERAQRGAAGDVGSHALLYAPAQQAWGTLRLVVVERELEVEEQRAVIWPAAVLEPRVRTVDSAHLGRGCSSAIIVDAQNATVRWLFMPQGMTLLASLDVRAGRGLMPLAALAEDTIRSAQIEGAGSTPAPGFDADALAASREPEDRTWPA